MTKGLKDAVKPYRCETCAKAFRSEFGRDQHAHDAHGASRPAPPIIERQEVPKIDPSCAECDSIQRLTDGRRIYPHRPDLYAKRFWLCECGAYCGCHPGTTIPLGTCAGPATRRARSAAHAAFDPLWKRRIVTRQSAYAWLTRVLGIDPRECHIAMMDAERARRVVEAVDALGDDPAQLINRRENATC